MNIPIKAAKAIANEYDWPEVVIFGYDPETGKQHVTTFGKTVGQCAEAAKAGNFLKKALGWPDELCHAKPAREKTRDNYKALQIEILEAWEKDCSQGDGIADEDVELYLRACRIVGRKPKFGLDE
jgi:hypothetical protein